MTTTRAANRSRTKDSGSALAAPAHRGQNAASPMHSTIAPRVLSFLGLLVVTAALTAACCKNTAPPTTAGAPTSSAVKELTVGSPTAGAARPTTKESCDACQGVWQRHGLADAPSCICKTKDGGKICRDGNECEGQCIAGDDGFEVVEQGPPAKGFWKGKCTDYDTTFGCNRTIAHGARAKGPQLAEDGAPTMCVD
jgi:hypothetical protein